jgi:hypothetical protein
VMRPVLWIEFVAPRALKYAKIPTPIPVKTEYQRQS